MDCCCRRDHQPAWRAGFIGNELGDPVRPATQRFLCFSPRRWRPGCSVSPPRCRSRPSCCRHRGSCAGTRDLTTGLVVAHPQHAADWRSLLGCPGRVAGTVMFGAILNQRCESGMAWVAPGGVIVPDRARRRGAAAAGQCRRRGGVTRRAVWKICLTDVSLIAEIVAIPTRRFGVESICSRRGLRSSGLRPRSRFARAQPAADTRRPVHAASDLSSMACL